MTTTSVVVMNQLDYKDLFSRISRSRLDLYVTASTPAGVSTFSADNLLEFYTWAMLQLARVNRPGGEQAYSISLVIREFTDRKDPPTGLPVKNVGGCLISRQGLVGLSAGQMQAAHTTDARTGRETAPEPAVQFVDWKWLFDRL